ncbi:unnamed protein product [Rhizoctonia solani]|uniref:DNA 3'-5' helicase n=1 Tax=Rhizoctonia solani TaxID=456999 RepID=A0A8H3CHL9_9AGAM|nr:unnamed protein product [Rhizoctonia solani]
MPPSRRPGSFVSSLRYGPTNPIAIPSTIRQRYGNLGELMGCHLGLPSIRPFQLDGVLYQVMGTDAVVHAGTGLGKTAIASGLYALPEYANKLTIMVSPLTALQSDMANTFNTKYPTPVAAVVVNSTMDGKELSQVFRDILAGKYRILLISPESLLSSRIRDELLLNPDFKSLVASIVIDEAHCVSVWGSGFRKKYGMLHVVRTYCPKAPIIAMSGTLTPRVIRDLENKLHLGSSYGFINVGNERPELSIVIRRARFPMNSFRDLTFIFNNPHGIHHPLDIPKTFIFMDNKNDAYNAIEVLVSCLPPHLRKLGIIRPFNARHGPQFRADAMKHFMEGNIRVLMSTDAAGMGCDIPDVDITIQWRVAPLSNVLQRWGRTARGDQRTGLVVLIAEPSAYNYNPTIPAPDSHTSKSKSGASTSRKPFKEPLCKGGFRSDTEGAQPELRDDSPLEGTLAMVQTNGCYRKIWTEVFCNTPIPPRVRCCSALICSPELLMETKPIAPPIQEHPVVRIRNPKAGQPHLPTQKELLAWRSRTKHESYPGASWSADGLLSDVLVDYLASIGPIPDYETLGSWLEKKWGWWEIYGHDLAALLIPLQTPYTPIPSQTRTGQKRRATVLELNEPQVHGATSMEVVEDRPPTVAHTPLEKPSQQAPRTKRARIVLPNQGSNAESAITEAQTVVSVTKERKSSQRAPKLSPYETLMTWDAPVYSQQVDSLNTVEQSYEGTGDER